MAKDQLYAITITINQKTSYHSLWVDPARALAYASKLGSFYKDVSYGVKLVTPEVEILTYRREREVKLSDSVGFIGVNK